MSTQSTFSASTPCFERAARTFLWTMKLQLGPAVGATQENHKSSTKKDSGITKCKKCAESNLFVCRTLHQISYECFWRSSNLQRFLWHALTKCRFERPLLRGFLRKAFALDNILRVLIDNTAPHLRAPERAARMRNALERVAESRLQGNLHGLNPHRM